MLWANVFDQTNDSFKDEPYTVYKDTSTKVVYARKSAEFFDKFEPAQETDVEKP